MLEQNEIVDSIATDRNIHPSLSSEGARANILGVGVDAVDMDGALAAIRRHLQSERKGYVCAVSVHGILESLRCRELAITYAESTINVPDGTPTVWVGRLQGFRQMDHVTGPALMQEVFRHPDFSSCSHYFYGGRPGVAQELARRMVQQYPWTRVAGTYTPPFRDLNEQEERDLVAQINALQPDIVWVGISTPRQELWIHRMLPRIETRLMFGVGAAFDFHTGRIRETPLWIKRAGFHWLHRLLQDPKRLWRRNVFNTAFLWHIALQLSGAREYPMRRSTANTERLSRDHKAGRIY
jgi:N-acetylglucosaminyldiphosphoundecaprenol N-acetyl-beta-D-mannosaminyltransferase